MIDTDTKYTDVLYNGEAITQKVVYKLEVDKPISAKIKTDVRFGGNAYMVLVVREFLKKFLKTIKLYRKALITLPSLNEVLVMVESWHSRY